MAKKKVPARAAPSTAAKPFALVTADWHLQDYAWADRKSLCGDAYYACEQIIDIAIARTVPIFAAGDIMDRKHNHTGPAVVLREQLRRARSQGVCVYFVQGDHDKLGVPWFNAVSGDAEWLPDLDEDELVLQAKQRDIHIRGIDYQSMDTIDEALDAVPEDTFILVMHQKTEEFLGGVATCELSFPKVPYARILILGDFHQQKIIKAKGRQGQDLLVLSPGSICMQAIDEDPEKKVLMLYDDMSVRSIKLKGRHYLRPPEILLEEQLDDFIKEVPDQIQRALDAALAEELPENLWMPGIWIKYSADVPDVYSRVMDAIEGKAHLFWKIYPSSTPEREEIRHQLQDVTQHGLIGALKHATEPGSEVYKVCHRLLSAADKKGELAALRAEFFAKP